MLGEFLEGGAVFTEAVPDGGGEQGYNADEDRDDRMVSHLKHYAHIQ